MVAFTKLNIDKIHLKKQGLEVLPKKTANPKLNNGNKTSTASPPQPPPYSFNYLAKFIALNNDNNLYTDTTNLLNVNI
ncbi:hypothetical protein C0J52_16698 [Blattella germanica]|nr:hypothetical protein C0J52_16698 [Blattella germanica]